MIALSSKLALLCAVALLALLARSVSAVPKSRFVKDIDEKKVEEVRY